MTKTKTLFVVGAGASKEVGLPIGSGLTGEIAKHLDIKFKDFNDQISGSRPVAGALRAHVKKNGESRDINPFLTASCWRIRDAMPQAASIDTFVDSHRGNAEIELCSKLGIAAAILEAERDSKLFIRGDGQDRLSFQHIGDHCCPVN